MFDLLIQLKTLKRHIPLPGAWILLLLLLNEYQLEYYHRLSSQRASPFIA